MSIETAASTLPVEGRKQKISLSIRTLDNGYLLSATRELPHYEQVELGIGTLPKLLKAIATFLKDGIVETGDVN